VLEIGTQSGALPVLRTGRVFRDDFEGQLDD
jgi:hypothetical protein